MEYETFDSVTMTTNLRRDWEKAVRTCAMVSSSVLGVALFITMALTATN